MAFAAAEQIWPEIPFVPKTHIDKQVQNLSWDENILSASSVEQAANTQGVAATVMAIFALPHWHA